MGHVLLTAEVTDYYILSQFFYSIHICLYLRHLGKHSLEKFSRKFLCTYRRCTHSISVNTRICKNVRYLQESWFHSFGLWTFTTWGCKRLLTLRPRWSGFHFSFFCSSLWWSSCRHSSPQIRINWKKKWINFSQIFFFLIKLVFPWVV